MCVCVYMRACVREQARVCVCVCVCACMCMCVCLYMAGSSQVYRDLFWLPKKEIRQNDTLTAYLFSIYQLLPPTEGEGGCVRRVHVGLLQSSTQDDQTKRHMATSSCVHTHAHAHLCTHTQRCTHTHTHTHTHGYAHTCTRMHILCFDTY